jgi:uncharacterized protein involved in exopolysaccharide biosynthesis/Mrp family chromosome partitioning ATPase
MHYAPAAQEAKSIQLSLLDLVNYLKRHWGKSLLLALPLAALTFAYLGLGKKTFEAETKILVSIRDAQAMEFNSNNGNGLSELSAPQIINNHRNRIVSRRYVDYLYSKLDTKMKQDFLANTGQLGLKDRLLLMVGMREPSKVVPQEELFASKMATAVRVDPIKESHLLRVAVRENDSALAADLANAYATQYVNYLIDEALSMSQLTSEALRRESEELANKLKESKERLQDYQEKADLIKDGDSGSGLGAQKAEFLSKAVNDAEVTVMLSDAELAQLRSARSSGMTTVIPGIGSDPIIIELRKKQTEVQSKLADWSQLCGKNHPKIIGFRRDLQENQELQQVRVDEIITEKENQLIASQKKLAQLQTESERARNMARDESQKSIQQSFLKDEAIANQELLRQLTLRMKQTDIATKVTSGGQVTVTDIAIAPDNPISPKKSIASVAAFLIFGLVGCGFPVCLGFLQDKIWPMLKQDPNKSTRVAAPNLAYSPVPPAIMQPPLMQTARVPLAPAVTAPAARSANTVSSNQPPAPILAHIPELFSAEPAMQFTELLHPNPLGGSNVIATICRALEQSPRLYQGPRIIMTTSAMNGEGKSLVAASIAASLCTSGAKVFLMECNPASPSLVNWFPQAENFSAAAHDLNALRYGLSNLFILPAHDLPSYDMSELLMGFRRWIDRAFSEVEWIILDGASLLMGFADIAQLAPLATDILFVHDSTRCQAEQLKAAFNLLRPITTQERIRGVVLNRHSLVTT